MAGCGDDAVPDDWRGGRNGAIEFARPDVCVRCLYGWFGDETNVSDEADAWRRLFDEYRAMRDDTTAAHMGGDPVCPEDAAAALENLDARQIADAIVMLVDRRDDLDGAAGCVVVWGELHDRYGLTVAETWREGLRRGIFEVGDLERGLAALQDGHGEGSAANE